MQPPCSKDIEVDLDRIQPTLQLLPTTLKRPSGRPEASRAPRPRGPSRREALGLGSQDRIASTVPWDSGPPAADPGSRWGPRFRRAARGSYWGLCCREDDGVPNPGPPALPCLLVGGGGKGAGGLPSDSWPWPGPPAPATQGTLCRRVWDPLTFSGVLWAAESQTTALTRNGATSEWLPATWPWPPGRHCSQPNPR